MQYFTDGDARHLICVPYSISGLHEMAQRFGLHRCWFHNSKKHPHYDLPKRRIEEFKTNPEVTLVSSREIIKLIKEESTSNVV